MRTTRLRPFLGLILAALAPAALGPPAAAAVMRPLPVERRALVVGVDGQFLGEGATPAASVSLAQLATLMRHEYGFGQVIELYNERATLEEIRRSLDALARPTARQEVSLLLYLSLDGRGQGSEATLVPAGARDADPWTLLPVMELQKLLAGAPQVRASLIVLPRCAAGGDYRQQSPGECLSRDPSRTLSTLAFCAVGDGARGRARLAALMLEALRAEAPETEVAATLLADRLRARQGARPGGYPGELWPLSLARCPEYGPDFVLVRERARAATLVTGIQSNATAADRRASIEQAVKEVLSLPTDQRQSGIAQVGATLLGRVSDRDEALTVRTAAAWAIGELRLPSATGPLGHLLADPGEDASLRRAALDALVAIGDPAATAEVRRALRDRDPALRLSSLRALALRQDAASQAEAAGLAADDPDPEVRAAALAALPRLGRANASVPVVVARLADPAAGVRGAAVSALERLGQDVARPEVLRLLRDEPDEGIRETVAFSLGRAADRIAPSMRREVERALVRATAAPNGPALRAAAAWSLGQVGGESAESRLLDLLRTPGEGARVRQAAAEGLARQKSPRAVEPLARLAVDAKEPLEVRRAAATALGAIGDPRAGDALFAVVKSAPDPGLREDASKALGTIETSGAKLANVAALSSDASPRVRLEAVRRLGQSGDPAAADLLLLRLGDEDYQVRGAAVEALAQRPDAAATARLQDVLTTPSESIVKRQGAAAALARQGTPEAARALVAAAAVEPSPLRAEVLLALIRFARQPGIQQDVEEAALAAARAADPGVRRAAAEALGALRTRRATEALRALSKDTDRDVSWAALEALGSARGPRGD